MMSSRKIFDLRKPVALPTPLIMRPCSDGSVLVIASSQPSWIVLRGDLELHVFSLIREQHALKRIIDEVRDAYGSDGEAALRRVLIEISTNEFLVGIQPTFAGQRCNMTLYLTNQCNLQCTHCYRFHEKPGEELSTDEWFCIIK